ncbi:hypothetical protein [Spiroplasma ixodetis]|uniref:Uncharacterized protein n=1 Tax=Spiroplasma ixodetis TaxID=2141 RepID=A0ABM8BS72_9MOLU|nr:hypothetical protein [Spiroplasma ixodetis]BDT02706.1 hypothetical protein SHM_03520 [Spiroplasma ixodetis]
MNNENIVINEFSLFQKNKEKMREYAQRPEVKVRRRKYDREWYHKNKEKIKAFLPLCTIFKSYHINAEKSLSTNFSPHF